MKKIFNVIYQTTKAFYKHDCINLAANISFYAIFSIAPLGMVTVSIAGYFIGSNSTAHEILFSSISEMFPIGKDVISANIQSIMDQKSSLGVVGLFFLLLFSTMIVTSLENALNKVFEASKERNFWQSRLLAIGLTFVFALLLATPTIFRIVDSIMFQAGLDFPISDIVNRRSLFFITAFVMFLIAVIIIPNNKVKFRNAVIGGLVFAPGIAIAKWIFTLFMTEAVNKYNIVYGSLSLAIILIIWTYYLSIVMLIASELVATLEEKNIS